MPCERVRQEIEAAGTIIPTAIRDAAGQWALFLERIASAYATADDERRLLERWDGGDRPDGPAGEEMPQGARPIALGDTWDAITVARGDRRPGGRGAYP